MDRHLMADPAVSGCLWLWKFKYPLHVLVKFIQFSLKNDEFGGGMFRAILETETSWFTGDVSNML